MGTNGTGILSFSLADLRRLQRSFDGLGGAAPSPAIERDGARLATALGATALPLLLRELVGVSEPRASFARVLLSSVTVDPSVRERVIDSAAALLGRSEIDDAGKLRALSLLAELGFTPPVALRDPESARDRTLGELARCLATPAEAARAADHLLGELSPDALEGFVADLADAAPTSAALLIDELLVRDDLPVELRPALCELRVSTGARRGNARPRHRPSALLGRHADGRRLLLVSARTDGRPVRLRALCALLSPDGRLIDGHAVDDLPVSGLQRALLEPLGSQGFRFAAIGLDAARGCLIQGARSAVLAGQPLPRDFYLGRDLLGLRDEHLDGTGRHSGGAELEALAARARGFLRAGEPGEARPLYERYVAEAPTDPEGHAGLGLCLLALGDPVAARHHVGRAAFLCPEEPLHQWNLAAAAHRAGDLPACNDALTRYLSGDDVAPDAAARRAQARRFVAEHARLRELDGPKPAAGGPAR